MVVEGIALRRLEVGWWWLWLRRAGMGCGGWRYKVDVVSERAALGVDLG